MGEEDAATAAEVWNVTAGGNFHEEATGRATGANVLHLTETMKGSAMALGTDERELATRMEDIRERLLEARSRRVRPGLDDKVLTDWNGLMIAALAKAGAAMGEPSYIEAARRATAFI
ncbi:MAG: thioredoxin domain-containing protein, partial [Thermoplasmata archaeon]|nr:thioredoxin domain-containing protein [Thermoplasmata archaeon]NIS21557.1 thioredoxin domain-containing protein [Thermoplasmata archaeon]NIT79123.1 thioredoxin domain-containing protein [Thermoplasmata archaeon]NIV80318.1 thioredoxin domain-containing protein [Thermoplasmata archaeon]NIW84124.1 thioredoxin domain-containing protein [Thermoplasmata archaeon]